MAEMPTVRARVHQDWQEQAETSPYFSLYRVALEHFLNARQRHNDMYGLMKILLAAKRIALPRAKASGEKEVEVVKEVTDLGLGSTETASKSTTLEDMHLLLTAVHRKLSGLETLIGV